MLRKLEQDPEWFARDVWTKLADANLLGLVVPEEQGGMGFGIVEACLLLEEVGRAVAPVPVLATLVLGGLPIAELGTPAQQQRWLEPMAAGKAILTAALCDAGSDDVTTPATTASADGDGFAISGTKLFVPAAHLAQRILVPAMTPSGPGIFLVDPKAAGVTLTRQELTNCEPVYTVELADVRVSPGDRLGDGDTRRCAQQLTRMFDNALTALSATQLGVCEQALDITVGYVTQREQFGAPTGTLPAVQHRCANMYIDLDAMRWTTWRSAWKLSDGQDATREAAVAKIWASEAGARIATASQHLHGGAGVDRDYPLHRYFLWSKALELTLGAAMPQLARLGRDMARTGPQELQ